MRYQDLMWAVWTKMEAYQAAYYKELWKKETYFRCSKSVVGDKLWWKGNNTIFGQKDIFRTIDAH